MAGSIGAPLDRVDGRLKVTGTARYSAEMPADRPAYAVLVQSSVASGRMVAIDTKAAEALPGVLFVMTHRSAPRLPASGKAAAKPPAGRVLTLLQDNLVHYNGQPIAVVVAESLEAATEAALRVKPTYRSIRPSVDPHAHLATAHKPEGQLPGEAPVDTDRGDVEAALAAADVKIDQTYTTPAEAHNPMEPHGTIAVWEGDKLTLYDSTQYVSGDAATVAKTLGITPDKVRVVCPFVGGGFGCKGSTWSHVPLAAMAAQVAKRPVKLVLSRRQMFGPVGGRPYTIQQVSIAAKKDGTLTAISHRSVSHTSRIEDWTEPAAVATRMLYACPNVRTSHRLVPLDLGTPTFQRAPGEATGTFALESAMDELAIALEMDPLELRLKNYAESDPQDGKPWSSKSLKECYRAAAEKFGWGRRAAPPGSRRDGNLLIGHGMATATYPTHRLPASALARLMLRGGQPMGLIQIGTQDLGTGTYTVMTQVAADTLGLTPDQIEFELGDTTLPPAPVSGGSMTAASAGSAVYQACVAARTELIRLATEAPDSPLAGVKPDQISAADSKLFVSTDSLRGEPIAAVLQRNGKSVEGRADKVGPGLETRQYGMHAFGAVFVEVQVDADLGQIRVPRVVAAYGAGRILNAKTARSQLLGGVVWGISMALHEQVLIHPVHGRIANSDLAEYHVPVNADIGSIEIIMVDERDEIVNPIGVKGIGEIGITGANAAVANAIYNATGIRVRDLPITLDKLLSRPTTGA